jgi:steroid delta-isomerase-like uncharacterized protein
MTGDARAVVESMIAAANRNDLDAQEKHFALDVHFRFDSWGMDTTGREELRAFVDRLLATFPDRTITIIATVCEGDRVVVESEFTATSPGGITGLPAAGKRFTTRVCSVYEVRGGVIQEMRDYLDRPAS